MTKHTDHKCKQKSEKPEVHPEHEPVTLKDFDLVLEAMVQTPPLKKKK